VHVVPSGSGGSYAACRFLRCIRVRRSTAASARSSEEVQLLLNVRRSLEQYIEHPRAKANCLNPMAKR
jgi:hypothetical protein